MVENELLPFNDIKINAAYDLEQALEFQDIKSFGDYSNKDFKSTRNLLLKLKSLQALYDFPQVRDSDICLFLRPDLIIHHSVSNSILSIRNLKENHIIILFWQNWKGVLNDRFAFCRGEKAKLAYACRAKHALEFCQRKAGPLQSEQLLLYSTMLYCVRAKELNVTASRISADGRMAQEDFSRRRIRTWHQRRRLTKDWDFSNSLDQ